MTVERERLLEGLWREMVAVETSCLEELLRAERFDAMLIASSLLVVAFDTRRAAFRSLVMEVEDFHPLAEAAV